MPHSHRVDKQHQSSLVTQYVMKKISSSCCSAGRLAEHVALQICCSKGKHLNNVIERDLVTEDTALHFSDSSGEASTTRRF